MRRRTCILLLAASIVACSATQTAEVDDFGAPTTPPASWKKTMHRLSDHFDIVNDELGKQPAGDLDAVTEAATAGARLLRLGYGKFEDPSVKDFGRMARDAESWLLRIAAEAGQGHGSIAQDLFRGGEARYCTRCHDASEKRQW